MQVPEPARSLFEITVSAILQELVVTGMHDDQVRLMPQHLFQNRHHPIAGVRHSAAVDHVPLAIRLRRIQADLKPRRERCLGGPRISLHRRIADAKDAELARRFWDGERFGIEMDSLGTSDLVAASRLVLLEQRPRLTEADKRIVVPTRMAKSECSECHFDQDKRQQAQQHGGDTKTTARRQRVEHVAASIRILLGPVIWTPRSD